MKKFSFAIITLLFCLVAFSFGFAVNDLWAGQAPSTGAIQSLIGQQTKAMPPKTYQQHFDVIQSRFIRKLDRKDLRYAGMSGLVASLGDPHTNFFEPVIAERFSMETQGDFVGIGARLGDHPLGATISSVFEVGPAARAGLKVNDVVTGVDGTKVAGVPVEQIVKKIRGEAGTKVKLEILRANTSEAATLTITRQKVEIPTAEGKMIGDIGYIAVSGFTEKTPKQFSKALQTVSAVQAKGIVIDLRGNGGGLLESASEMLSHFVEGKKVVSMRFRGGEERVQDTDIGELTNQTKNIVVLIDESSASASEIFAGCMRDYGLAKLVGEHTYGKTSVQNVHVIPVDQASVKVTIAKYYLPSGTNFDRKVDADGNYISGGLKPDIVVDLDTSKQVVIGEPESDNQLATAIETLRKGS